MLVLKLGIARFDRIGVNMWLKLLDTLSFLNDWWQRFEHAWLLVLVANEVNIIRWYWTAEVTGLIHSLLYALEALFLFTHSELVLKHLLCGSAVVSYFFTRARLVLSEVFNFLIQDFFDQVVMINGQPFAFFIEIML